MRDFPIGGFLCWNLKAEKFDEWPVYKFICDYDEDSPHNDEENLSSHTTSIQLVIDGQQRITALCVGLGGSYRQFYYRWKKMKLYLNLLKKPEQNEEDPEKLTYEFRFWEDPGPANGEHQIWYPVGRILKFNDAEYAKDDIDDQLSGLSPDKSRQAKMLIGQLHNRIHTQPIANYYLEDSQDYDKVLQVFIRANSGGVQLEYSDLLLATATAKWKNANAREEILDFRDRLNDIGHGFNLSRDLVLKSCLYLTGLPVQYKVRNFTTQNLLKIEENWQIIKTYLRMTVTLISKYGLHAKNVLSPNALLPVAYHLMKKGNQAFHDSSSSVDVAEQESIRKWLVISMLKGAFGGSTDGVLTKLRNVLDNCHSEGVFPVDRLNDAIEIKADFSEDEIERMLQCKYKNRNTYLILSLLYPDRHWKDVDIHIDHIYPISEFSRRSLKSKGLDDDQCEQYASNADEICNLQLLTGSENREKSNCQFDRWIESRDDDFCARHSIPKLPSYDFKNFLNFVEKRRGIISSVLDSLNN